MIIRRCAWPRKYFGFPKLIGIAGWLRRGVLVTDGLCRRCQRRMAQEHAAVVRG